MHMPTLRTTARCPVGFDTPVAGGLIARRLSHLRHGEGCGCLSRVAPSPLEG